MALRVAKFSIGVFLGVLFSNSVMGQYTVRDWELRIESDAGADQSRVASTRARAGSGKTSIPSLVIRRKKPDSPIELLIIDTHDAEKEKCEFTDWKVNIDALVIPVVGYSFEPTKTALKANWETPDEELWSLFRKGIELLVQVQEKCDSYAGKSKPVNLSFSLLGSNAAYKFVHDNAD